MSWSVEAAGTKDDVKAVIVANDYVPQVLKDDICARIDKLDLDPWPSNPNGMCVLVKSHGHLDDRMGGNYTVEVRVVASCVKPAPLPPPPAPAA